MYWRTTLNRGLNCEESQIVALVLVLTCIYNVLYKSVVINSYGLLRYSFILGIWTDEPCVVITTSVETRMSYGYIVIQVVY